MTREHLLVSQLAVIDRVIGWVCARRCLRGADAEDFASMVKGRLIEDDYDVLARFEGRSSLKTYLATVVTRLYLDFQVQRFGKWRTSAEARRLGPVAVRLEALLYRDGLTFDEACGVLATDARVSHSRDALYDISLRLPRRLPRGAGPEEVQAERRDLPSSALERAERQALAGRTFAVIERSLARLPARERLFLRLHLEQGLTVAEVARSLGLDQKALYRRKEEIFRCLRADLETEGIEAAHARELLSAVDWSVALRFEAAPSASAPETPGSRPSQAWRGAAREEGEQ
jgi:RNA polymerase sigma factor (sigma-70 family)